MLNSYMIAAFAAIYLLLRFAFDLAGRWLAVRIVERTLRDLLRVQDFGRPASPIERRASDLPPQRVDPRGMARPPADDLPPRPANTRSMVQRPDAAGCGHPGCPRGRS